jgi:hypothetical protein
MLMAPAKTLKNIADNLNATTNGILRDAGSDQAIA